MTQPAATITHVKGSELQVGDTIRVWWSSVQAKRGGRPNEDTITGLRPYNGPLKNIFPEGAQLADFMYLHTGMTIENNHYYEKLVSDRPR